MALRIDGDALKDLRRANGWTLRQFAADAHASHGYQLSHGYISRVENNLVEATPERMWQIADTLGVPLAALTGDKKEFTAALAEALRHPRGHRAKAGV